VVRLFYSYSHRDAELRDELERHLAMLGRDGLISAWHDRQINAGSEWAGEIDSHLESAQIVLLLVSADFLASNYCYDIEATRALERHERGEAVVIPIILRPCDWQSAPFGRLQALPSDAKAVTDWANRDQAFKNIAKEIREVVRRRFSVAADAAKMDFATTRRVESEQERVLDAALAKQVTVGRPTELVAVVRQSSSGGLRALLDVEDDPELAAEDVKSKSFRMEFPQDYAGYPTPVNVRLTIDAPEFDPPTKTKLLSVPPDRDSEICRFMLTPRRAGQLRVMLEVSVEDVYQTARTLRTSAQTVAIPQQAAMWLVSVPLFSTSAPARVPAPQPSFSEHAAEGQSEIARPAPVSAPEPRSYAGAAEQKSDIPSVGKATGTRSKRVRRVAGSAGALAAMALAGSLVLQLKPPPDSTSPPHTNQNPPIASASSSDSDRLELGDHRFAIAPAEVLAPTSFSRTPGKFTEFASRIGGVAFASEAVSKQGLVIVGMRYVPQEDDGKRLQLTVRDRYLRDHQVIASIYDWQLQPLVAFVRAGGHAAATLFGELKDKELQDRVRKRYFIANYHPAFQNTLLGLRLLQADLLVINRSAADLFKSNGNYILGSGEAVPTESDITLSKRHFDDVAGWRKRQNEFFESYVVGDVGTTVEFSIAGDTLVLTGDPTWYCWRRDTKKLDEIIDLLSGSVDAFILAWMTLRFDPRPWEVNRFAEIVIRRLNVPGKDSARSLLVPEVTLRKLLRLSPGDRGEALLDELDKNVTRLDSYPDKKKLEGEVDSILEAYERRERQVPFVQMDAYSHQFSRVIREVGGINPTVYSSLQTAVRFTALFRYVAKNQPRLLDTLAASLSSDTTRPVQPINYQVKTPTVVPRDRS
jgi:hypothetical protein